MKAQLLPSLLRTYPEAYLKRAIAKGMMTFETTWEEGIWAMEEQRLTKAEDESRGKQAASTHLLSTLFNKADTKPSIPQHREHKISPSLIATRDPHHNLQTSRSHFLDMPWSHLQAIIPSVQNADRNRTTQLLVCPSTGKGFRSSFVCFTTRMGWPQARD